MRKKYKWSVFNALGEYNTDNDNMFLAFINGSIKAGGNFYPNVIFKDNISVSWETYSINDEETMLYINKKPFRIMESYLEMEDITWQMNRQYKESKKKEEKKEISMNIKNIENASIEELEAAKELINKLLAERSLPKGVTEQMLKDWQASSEEDITIEEIKKYKWYVVYGRNIPGFSGAGFDKDEEFLDLLNEILPNEDFYPDTIFLNGEVVEWHEINYININGKTYGLNVPNEE